MEKLIKIFEYKTLSLRTFDVSLLNIIKQETDLAKECAEECKQIACDFAYYMYTNHIDTSLTMDKIFNEFLEQYRNDLYNNYDKNVLI